MEQPEVTNKADLLLRPIANVKISNENSKTSNSKEIVAGITQPLSLPESLQDEIIETLKFIHGPNFKLNGINDYDDTKSYLIKRYAGPNNLVVKGVCEYSKVDETDILKQFALMRLQSYGFHINHCTEAYECCEQNLADAIEILYFKCLKIEQYKNYDVHESESELLKIREEEKSALEAIYPDRFREKTPNIWIVAVKPDCIYNIFYKKESIEKKPRPKTVAKCWNFTRGIPCKYGKKCRFSHETDDNDNNSKSKTSNEFSYFVEIEFRFPENTKYPYEPPLIFVRTNMPLPPQMTLHIAKKLYEEALSSATYGSPSAYGVIDLLENEYEIEKHVRNVEMSFLHHKEKLFPTQTTLNMKNNLPTRYQKGITNKNFRKNQTNEQIIKEDQKIIDEFKKKIKSSNYNEMLKTRMNLPAWTLQNDILNTIKQSQIVVISGETGCGKSTQVPQFILDEWINNYNNKHLEIVCTQPRRISAIGVASRVAKERVENVGSTVGYEIRLENKVSIKTRLTFCTTGILLRRLEGDAMLSRVTHVIVDEVHERSEECDFLLLLLKELLPVRPDLKVILMSATLKSNIFSTYFGEIPVVNIPGRTFPVEQYFLENILEETGYVLENDSKYCRKIKIDSNYMETMFTVQDLHINKPSEKIPDESLTIQQLAARYQEFSATTCKNLFLMDVNKINNELIESVLMWIVNGNHNYPKTGTILIFLPGIGEITTLYEELICHEEFGKRTGKYLILPLHSSLSNEKQAEIFQRPKHGERKIVISTNLAETSITIDDCVYVIDSGKMKETRFDPNKNMSSLDAVWVTQANALQRKGRAGRVMNGVCIHLYTSNRFNQHFLTQPIPEIHRISLDRLVLNIKVQQRFYQRNVTDVLGAFIEPPGPENISSAIKRLQSAGALEKDESLTALGLHLANLPVDVQLGKLILYGAIFGCLDSALTVAACLNSKTPFVLPFEKKEEAAEKKLRFSNNQCSDHLTVLMAYKKFIQLKRKSDKAAFNFTKENYLSYKTLLTIADIKYQFLELLVDIGFVPLDITGIKKKTGDDNILEITGSTFNTNGENFKLLTSILCAALYPNIVKIILPVKKYVESASGAIVQEHQASEIKFATKNEIVFMHPSSVNFHISTFPGSYLIYQEKIRTSKVYFRDCTAIHNMPLVLFSGDLDIVVHDGTTYLTMEDKWIIFQAEEHQVAELIKMIRIELYSLLEEKIQDPLLNILQSGRGQRVVDIIMKLISL